MGRSKNEDEVEVGRSQTPWDLAAHTEGVGIYSKDREMLVGGVKMEKGTGKDMDGFL